MLGHSETAEMSKFYLGIFMRLAAACLTLLGHHPGLRVKWIIGTGKGTTATAQRQIIMKCMVKIEVKLFKCKKKTKQNY